LDADLDHGSKLDLDLKELMAKRQKEQARQLFFKGDCKVSTMEFLSTCKNVYNNLSRAGSLLWLLYHKPWGRSLLE
jgi:hypothetical protein